MTRTSRRASRVAGVAGTLVLLAATAIWLQSTGGLHRSDTCDDVEPGGARPRSVPSPDSSEAVSSPDPPTSGVAPAFRPETAQAVYCADLADPFVLRVERALGDRLFVYGTQTGDATIPVLISSSLTRSDRIEDALPTVPSWSAPGRTWAPAVLSRGAKLVLYYATTDRASGLQCISRAVGGDPAGPFEDTSTAPLICPTDLGGAIDPSPFVDRDGNAHLLWKSDGNCCGKPSRIFVQPLEADGLTVTGEPTELLGSTQVWEGGVVESPGMIEVEGTYYLFYSGNAWDTSGYAIGYATCTSVTGPCSKPLEGPWLGSTDAAQGPGGQSFFVDGGGQTRIVFHAWVEGAPGYENGGFRSLFTAGIEIRDGHPVTA